MLPRGRAIIDAVAKLPAPNLEVRPKWWFSAYLWGVAICAEVFGAEPDWGKVLYWAARGHRVFATLGPYRWRVR